jgi:hypothetical protein
MDGMAVAITAGTTGTVVAMTGAIGDGIEIVTVTGVGVTHDEIEGTGSGKEIN